MMWNIVSDSSCDLRMASFSSETVRFESVPLRIQVGGQEFLDNDELSVPEMLTAMAEEKAASSSACPSPAAFAKAFEAGECTVCFTISANLSGTYNAAVMGREMALEEHPEKKICVIDSKATAGAMVLLIRRAQALMEAAAGPEDFENICSELREYQASLRTCFTLECFDNLIKTAGCGLWWVRCCTPWASMSLPTPRPRAPSMWRTRPGARERPTGPLRR